jgi:hypothetical protein
MSNDMGSMRVQQQQLETSDDLMTLLFREYFDRQEGKVDDVVRQFARWARGFLVEHRPVRTFAADANVGLELSGGQRVLVSLPVAQSPMSGEPGGMAKTPLSPEQSVGIPPEAAEQGAVPISGRAPRPPGSVSYRDYDAAQFAARQGQKEDLRQGKMPESLDQKGFYGREL